MAERWFKGERPPAEEFLNRHPELWHQPEPASRLVYEEICLRQDYLDEASTAEVIERFPQWRNQLLLLVDCHRLLETNQPASPQFPEQGEVLGDFRMIAELGRGAVGRVFLAAQLSLNGRAVVLKLSPCTAPSTSPLLPAKEPVVEGEHLSLARLQHTYIVPLYSAQDYPERNVRALCMPYFGGVTLDRILEKLRDKPLHSRTGKDLLAVLDKAPSPLAENLPPRGPERQRLAEVSYVDAICILGLCLADALHYAHQRNLVHLDLKPANVLLAADGKPMLLDFHLAQPPILATGPAPKRLGGTPLYMSPEQEKALAAIRGQQRITATVDGRSDLYSLGLVLYQALGGPFPVDLRGPSRLREANPQVPVGLADILHRCMAPSAADRYPDAAALAADLDRQLTHQPLRGVRNRSVAERWRKWRRRRPLALAWLLIMLIALSTAVASISFAYQRRQEVRTALDRGTQCLEKGEPAQAQEVMEHGLRLAHGLPFTSELIEELQMRLRDVDRAQEAARLSRLAQDLHGLTDQVRFRSLADGLSAAGSQGIATRCRKLWDLRGQILQQTNAGQAQTDGPGEQIKLDLRDLGIMWADLCVRSGERQRLDEAMHVLEEAERDFGPSPVLFEEQRAVFLALGLADRARDAARRAAEVSPRTAWEHYALGRALLHGGDLSRAASEFEQALELDPQSFWPNFYHGWCAYRLKQPEEALASFRICVALRPDAAWCFYNRALAHAALQQNDRALKDYNRALQMDAELAPAYLNRGLLHYREKDYARATSDFGAALRAGADPAIVRQNLELVSKAQRLPKE
jgi:serine/threonine protein kinase/Tfp pilus assembly protein PilF